MDFPEEGGVKDSKWGGHWGGGTGSFTEGGCWVKGDLALGKDWEKSSLSWVYVALHSLPLLNSPSIDLVPFHPGSSFSIKGLSGGWAITYFWETERNTKLVAAIRHLNLSSQPWLQLILIAFDCIPVRSAHPLLRLSFLPARR